MIRSSKKFREGRRGFTASPHTSAPFEPYTYPKLEGKGPEISKIGKIYLDLIHISGELPEGVNAEDYLTARRALEKMWIGANTRDPEEVKDNIYRTEDGDYPKEDSFITCSYISKTPLSKEERANPWITEGYGTTEMEGLHDMPYMATRGMYLHKKDYPDYSIDEHKAYPYLPINYVKNKEVHVFRYYGDLDLLEELEAIPVKGNGKYLSDHLLKWRYDTPEDLDIAPKEVLDRITSKRY